MLILYFLLLPAATLIAQVRVSGKVYDFSQSRPLEAVSVMSTHSGGTQTDENGKYTIIVNENDSIWFSYLGKATPKYPVLSIGNIQNFEVALHVNTSVLKEVLVMPPNYKRDSVQNREDYAEAFNFHRPNLESLTSITPSGVGLDIDEVIRAFQFKKNRRMMAFQKRLLQEEQDKFIDHRFSRALVIRLTHLQGADLDTFMVRYRPELEFTMYSSDYEFQSYIKQCYGRFLRMQQLYEKLHRKEDE